MTVAELKEMLRNWPDTDEDGNPYEVWTETGHGLSSPVDEVWLLNEADVLFTVSDSVWESA